MEEKYNSELDNFEPVARIVVIGVGGAGNNAVNRMLDENMETIDFWVANTDKQALATSRSRQRIVLGAQVTGGLGAGGNPDIGRQAAEESLEDIRAIVKGANMVFIAAGMGGGTGTGAAPVIARIAKEEGCLTVGIVTRPFSFEGKKRIANSVSGLTELKKAVDSMIIVSNDKLLMTSGNIPIGQAFHEADSVLAQSVKTVTDLILMPAVINLDFADVRNVLKASGISLIGFGLGQGENKARDAAHAAVSCPLLESSLNGARKAIVAITCGPLVSLIEAQETVDRIIEIAGTNLDIKFGVSINEQLSDQILVSVIASDFAEEYDYTAVPSYQTAKPVGKENALGPISLLDGQEPTRGRREETIEEETSLLPEFLSDKHLA